MSKVAHMSVREAGYAFPGSTPFILAADGPVNPVEVQRFAPFSRLTGLCSQVADAPTKEASQAILDAAAAELPAIQAAFFAAVDCVRDVALGLGLDDRFGVDAPNRADPNAPKGKSKKS